MDLGLFHARKKPLVERPQLDVDRLGGPTPQVDGHLDLATLQLPFVQEAKAWRQKGDDGGGAVLGRGKHLGGARLVVVLEKAGAVILEVEPGGEMRPHRRAAAGSGAGRIDACRR